MNSTMEGARRWMRPALAPILRSATMCRALAALGAAQIGLALAHIRGLDCPVLTVTGLPCPGCGASRACADVLIGRFQESIAMHPLAPMLLAGWIILLIAAILPASCRMRLAILAEGIERRVPLGLLFFISLCVVWIARLLVASAGAATFESL
ncbi:hypothetical protein BH09PLA1_BH09PLA1_34310 [soil metagenome]